MTATRTQHTSTTVNNRQSGPPSYVSPSRLLPRRTRRAVLAADRYRCVFCADTRDLEIDHVIPHFYGGQERWRNLVTLCRFHNRVKGTYFLEQGVVKYRAWPGRSDITMAAAILAAERRALRNPLRWFRLFLAVRHG